MLGRNIAGRGGVVTCPSPCVGRSGERLGRRMAAAYNRPRGGWMADPAQRRMTVEEFLVWDGEGDTRYQLRDGVPVAMAPPSSAHSILAGNLAGHVFVVLQKRPGCRVQSEAGLRSSRNSRSFHHVDLGVSCSPATRGEHE